MPQQFSSGRRGGHLSARPARRPSGPSRNSGRSGGRSAPPPPRVSELDRALAVALAAPAPEPATFRELGLPRPLVDALAANGIHEPFSIQSRTLPDALAGRDVLGRAQTGSGKTLAFGLPMLTRLAATREHRRDTAPRGLILVPTRELASQVTDALSPLAATLGLRVTAVYGGASIGRQIDRLRRGVDAVVATPGRLIDLLERRACVLGDVEIAVLDEADHMADLGFLPAVTRILDETPADGQRMLFSATLDRGVEALVRRYLNDPAIHAVASATASVDAMDHRVFVLPAQDKVAIAAEIGGRPGRTLFFVRTKHGADRLALQLGRAGARGTVVALIQPDQVRAFERLQDAAGVQSISHQVHAGDDAVREVSTSGTPVPPAPPVPPARTGYSDRAGRGDRAGRPPRSRNGSGRRAGGGERRFTSSSPAARPRAGTAG